MSWRWAIGCVVLIDGWLLMGVEVKEAFVAWEHLGQLGDLASASAFVLAMCSFRSFSLRAFCWWKPRAKRPCS